MNRAKSESEINIPLIRKSEFARAKSESEWAKSESDWAQSDYIKKWIE